MRYKTLFFYLLPVFFVATFITSWSRDKLTLDKVELKSVESKNLINGDSLTTECDPCNCAGLYQNYLVLYNNCIVYGGSYCTQAQQALSSYYSCLGKEPTCPPGFEFDGCNCYSGVHFPSGYNGFVFGNGFYVQQNCSISTANNCCPSGFTFDGANCNYVGLYFPPGYTGFVYGNAFYTTPGPCQ